MFPDAEAAVIIGAELGLPVATLAVGSDVMVYPRRLPVLSERLRTTLQHVDLPIGVSQSICRKLAETGACRREPLCVYLSRDVETFTPVTGKNAVRLELGWPTEAVVAVYLGGLVETKGISELVAACEPLLKRYTNFTLVCVGEGPMRRELTTLAGSVERAGSVILTGRVKPEDVPRLLQGADFMILPSHSEGMPQAVLEAMNCSLPVVAARVGGVPEAVVDGETGLLVDPRSPEQLRAAVECMIADMPFRRRAGENGRTRACDVFDSEANAQVLADALLALAPKRSESLVGAVDD
jgi:glycosyltransferase involved in cell wall biosynthesis